MTVLKNVPKIDLHSALARFAEGRPLREVSLFYSVFNEPGTAKRRVLKSCGAERFRTDDLRLAKPALSQLSYGPVKSRGPGQT